MSVQFSCPSCQQILSANPDQAGTRVACPKCQQPLQVPGHQPTQEPRERPRRRDNRRDEDRPRREEHHYHEAPKGSAGHGLGVASFVLGCVGLVLAIIPCTAPFSFILSGLGLLLGIAGLIVAIAQGRGLGFPIAGSVVCGAAIAVAVVWIGVLAAGANAVDEELTRQHRERLERIKERGKETIP